MNNLIFVFAIIAATVGLIYLIRLFSAGLQGGCRRPRAELRISYGSDCECLEYYLGRIFRCPELRDTDLSVTVVDLINTGESRKWLEALRSKLKWDFEVITEEESKSGGTAKSRYD